MPFGVRKRKCIDAQGNTGNYIVFNRETGKKVSCHKNKELAERARKVREAKSND